MSFMNQWGAQGYPPSQAQMSARYPPSHAQVSVGCGCPHAQVSVGCPPPPSFLGLHGKEWKSFQFHIHNFASLSTAQNVAIKMPAFTCADGHLWQLRLNFAPGVIAQEQDVSAYVSLISFGKKSTTKTFAINIIDKFINSSTPFFSDYPTEFRCGGPSVAGFPNLIRYSDIMEYILDRNGALTIVVSMKEEPKTLFVPQNPLAKTMLEMFNNERTSDVRFVVVANSGDQRRGKRLKSTVTFHAHRFILKSFAPFLADVLGENDTATLSDDVTPEVFHHLLYYIYGGEMKEVDLKANAKEIIDAADKYAIVNLKLAAEAAYVETKVITIDNAIDNLLYADGKNCALLKEKVLDFLAENPNEASEKISFSDCPSHVMKDLLAAVGRNYKKESSGNEDELSKLSVNKLRWRLHEKGLEVDGSREAMIETLKNSNPA